MSAAEKLIALDERMPRGVVPWQRYGNDISIPEVDIVRWAYADLPPSQWEDADERAAAVLDPIVALRNALPQIVAVVEVLGEINRAGLLIGASFPEEPRRQPQAEAEAALAALDEALSPPTGGSP